MQKTISGLLVIIMLSSILSCIAIGTGGKKSDDRPTLGQEMMDLQKARDEGAISQQEYDELKKKLKQAYQ